MSLCHIVNKKLRNRLGLGLRWILCRMSTQFGVPVINILWTIVAGKRFQSSDPRVHRMMDLLNQVH